MTDPTQSARVALADAAAKLLARESAPGEGSDHVGPATVRACRKLCTHLERLVGRHGAAALFARSVALNKGRFPCLDVPVPGPQSDDSWQALLVSLEASSSDQARAAALSLLTSFVELLGRLIGDALVGVLLAEIWPEDFPLAPPSTATEETP